MAQNHDKIAVGSAPATRVLIYEIWYEITPQWGEPNFWLCE
jgi:hypothetical protein